MLHAMSFDQIVANDMMILGGPTSILGAPAVTVPMLAIEGMPVGIQIVGQRHADARTAGIARWLFESVTPVSVD